MYKPKKDNSIFKLILLLVAAFGVMIYNLLPALSDFRNSLAGDIVSFIFVGGLILYVTLSKKINMPLLGKIVVWAFGAVLIAISLLNWGRIEALILFVYSICNVAVSIIIYIKTKQNCTSIWAFGAFAYLSTITFVMEAHYLNEGLQFWLPALIFTLILFAASLIFVLTTKIKIEPASERVAIPLCALLLGFCFTWLTLSSMNIYLDTSEPTYQEYVIVEKDIDSGARRITTYDLTVERDGERFEISVREEVYYDVEINDTIQLSIYQGAFGEPYVIYDE